MGDLDLENARSGRASGTGPHTSAPLATVGRRLLVISSRRHQQKPTRDRATEWPRITLCIFV